MDQKSDAAATSMLLGASMRDVSPPRYGMGGAGRTTVFQLALALGVAVGVTIVGSPDTAGEALGVHRAAWLASAAALAVLAVTFLMSYPEADPDVDADVGIGADVQRGGA